MDGLKVDRAEVLRYLGYRGQEIDTALEEKLCQLTARCMEVATPQYLHAEYPVEVLPDGVSVCGTSLVFRGEDIRRHLYEAERCALLAATLGAAVERELLVLERRSVTDAVIFDAVCTALIESVTDRCESELVAAAAAEGKYTNFRYSPGYGDFPLSIQRELLMALEAPKRIGLTVTENCLMIPRKSVTAVVGIFDRPQPTSKRGCESCNLRESCQLRRRGRSCGQK